MYAKRRVSGEEAQPTRDSPAVRVNWEDPSTQRVEHYALRDFLANPGQTGKKSFTVAVGHLPKWCQRGRTELGRQLVYYGSDCRRFLLCETSAGERIGDL